MIILMVMMIIQMVRTIILMVAMIILRVRSRPWQPGLADGLGSRTWQTDLLGGSLFQIGGIMQWIGLD